MKKIRRILLAVLVALVFVPVLCTSAQAEAVPRRYDPATEGILSGYLRIDPAGYIRDLAPGTTVEQLNKLSLPGDLTADTQTVGTGTVLSSALAGQSLIAVVTGDTNGDAEVSITDMLMVKSHILGTELEQPGLMGGDVNRDGEVSISDFLLLKSYLLGLEQFRFGESVNATPLRILAPGQSQSWLAEAASFESGNEALVTVSPDGRICAGTQEGTAFVYGLDAAGNVLSRTAVTVLEGGLTLTLDRSSYSVCPRQSLPLTATLNHPVQANIRWESGDETVCTVSADGVITGQSYGDTVIRAILESGYQAEAAVKVMPPITELTIAKKLYKLKPGTDRPLEMIMTPADVGEEVVFTVSDDSVATVSADGVVTGVDYGTVTVTATGKYSGLKAVCTVKVCNVKQVAMTFDDGPSTHTATLLDYLKENQIPATFFLVGNRLNSYKGTVKRIAAEGHELGYHSYSHKNHKSMSTDKIKSDFRTSEEILKKLTGKTFTLWRAPGGNINDRVLNAIDLPHIMWTVDTRDWDTRNTESVYKAIIKNAGDGKIILLHDLYKTTVNGAIKAMKEMLAGDYEFVTVTELLSRDGTPPEASVNYSKAS